MRNGKVLALITARGGSKGLPRKNILHAGGKPLVSWTVDAALAAKSISRVVLSSDDDEIMIAAKAAGCDVPFRRPPELASDAASSMDVIEHALDQLPGYDYIVLLQPTSPLRTGADIDAAFALMRERDAPSCISVTEVRQSPFLMYRLRENQTLESLFPPLKGVSRRQDLPSIYMLNGAIYIAKIDWLRRTKSFLHDSAVAYQMPAQRSIDIDDAEDFAIFRRMVEGA